MNSTLGTTPIWALRAVPIVILLSSLLLAATGHAWYEMQALAEKYEQTYHSALDYKKAEREIREKMRRQRKQPYVSPIALQRLFPIGERLKEDIAILMLDANFKKKQTRLEIAAKSVPGLLDFTARVQKIPFDVKLNDHRMEKEKSQLWPVRATMNINLSAENSGDK